MNPGVVGSHHRSPLLVLQPDVLTKGERALVLVGVLELSTSVHTDDTTLRTFDSVNLVFGLKVVVGDDLVGTVHRLTILAGLESPLDVLGWCRVEMVVDVSERVLLDVGNTDVLVLVDVTGGWNKFTSQDIDKCRLASSVGTNNSNTRSKRTLEGDVLNLRLLGARVLEGHVADTHDGFRLGLDAFQETRLWELEFHI